LALRSVAGRSRAVALLLCIAQTDTINYDTTLAGFGQAQNTAAAAGIARIWRSLRRYGTKGYAHLRHIKARYLSGSQFLSGRRS